MANRRMITQDIFGRADFMELPPACVALYTYLCLWADDDGFVAAPERLAFMLGYDPLTLKLLKEAGFIICFDKGPCAVTHWHMANKIKADRYRPTVYQKERSQLTDGPDGYRRKTKADRRSAAPASGDQDQPEEKDMPEEQDAPVPAPEPPAAREGETPAPAPQPEPPSDQAGAPAQKPRAPWDDPARIPCNAMPLLGGGLYTPAPEQVEEWKALYPDVNVLQELRYIRGWLGSDPRRQRPREAMGALINHWLRGAQDKAASRPKEPPASYDIERFEQRMNTTVPKLPKRKK